MSGRFYAQAASNAPSTASLLPPHPGAPRAVQAAFARAPPSIRSVPSLNSLVRPPPLLARPLTFHRTPRTPAQPQAGQYCPSPTRQAPFRPPAHPPIPPFQFSLSPDPKAWGADLSPNHPEPDDYLHNPDPRRDRNSDRGGSVLTYRGLTNLGCLVFLALGLVALLYVLSSLSSPP